MPLKKNWEKPHLRLVDAAAVCEQSWGRPELLRLRALSEQALALIEANGDPDTIEKARETLRAIDAELIKTSSPRDDPHDARE